MFKLTSISFVLALAISAAPLPQFGAHAAPLVGVTLKVGAPHDGATVYGPADMLCDLDKCHMFFVPGLPATNTVDFQMPQLTAQDRTDFRHCFNLCRVSVLGYASDDRGHPTPGQRNPSITITPVELRLEAQQPAR